MEEHIERVSKRIRNELSSRSRPVESGCVVRIPLSSFIDHTQYTNITSYIYGVVGRSLDYCTATTARAYHVVFCLDNVDIPSANVPLLHLPIYDNEMEIVRYPDQNASLDDPNLDLLFHKVDGKWTSRSSKSP